MDILIFGGQSNMQGQTESCPSADVVPNAWEYRFSADTAVPLRHPVGEDFGDLLLGAHEGHGSLVPDFCRAYGQATHRRVWAVHAAKGATTLADWDPSGARYAFALRKIKAAIAKAAQTERVENIYYIWLQGESDALAGTTRGAYLSALTAYKNALVRDVGITAFGIIRVGFFTSEAPRDIAVMRAQEDAAKSDPDFVMLTRVAGKLSRDPRYLNPYAAGHYNNEGMTLLGAVAGNALGRYALGERNVSDGETVAEIAE